MAEEDEGGISGDDDDSDVVAEEDEGGISGDDVYHWCDRE